MTAFNITEENVDELRTKVDANRKKTRAIAAESMSKRQNAYTVAQLQAKLWAMSGKGEVFTLDKDLIIGPGDPPLAIPHHVTLDGGQHSNEPFPDAIGPVIYITANHNYGSDWDNEPIVLWRNAKLQNAAIMYPNQVSSGPPIRYPSTLKISPYYAPNGSGPFQAHGAAVANCHFLNPYRIAVINAGRVKIEDVKGQPLGEGLHFQKSLDKGTIRDIHFWPFWSMEQRLCRWMYDASQAFIFGHFDWFNAYNLFCYGYAHGFNFYTGGDHLSPVPGSGPTGSVFGAHADGCKIGLVLQGTGAGGVKIYDLLSAGNLSLPGPDAAPHRPIEQHRNDRGLIDRVIIYGQDSWGILMPGWGVTRDSVKIIGGSSPTPPTFTGTSRSYVVNYN